MRPLPHPVRILALGLLGTTLLTQSAQADATETTSTLPGAETHEAQADDDETAPNPDGDGEHDVEGSLFLHPPGAVAGAYAGFTNVTLGVPPPAKGAAVRYAALDRRTCERELTRRRIAFDRVDEARGVLAPVRVKGPIGGVDIHSMLPEKQRKTSPYEIYDCRLVLALDDFARVLRRHDIVEVVHYSVYRPPPRSLAPGKPGKRHGAAMAIDMASFKTSDGKTLSVLSDFNGRVGGKTCSEAPLGLVARASGHLAAPAVTLRELVCEAANAQLFNVLLTPHYNWAHKNHFHLEVTPHVKWMVVR